MAKLQCPDCAKTFKGESGLSWHRERSHPAGSSGADGTAGTAIVGQEQPVIGSAGTEDPEWWPSVDDLFEEDEPLALHDLLNRGFPELSRTVEALAKSSGQALSEREADRLKVRDMESKVAALEALTTDISRRLGEQVTWGDRVQQRAEVVERQLRVLSDLVRPLMVLALHTDGHQRGETMNVTSLVEAIFDPPRWTLCRREEVYEAARQKLLEFLKSVPEHHGPLANGRASPATVTTRATPALRG